jgi:hypothetical protein
VSFDFRLFRQHRSRCEELTASICGQQYLNQPTRIDYHDDFAVGSMLSKKDFEGNKRNFLELLMRFVRGDLRGPHRVS